MCTKRGRQCIRFDQYEKRRVIQNFNINHSDLCYRQEGLQAAICEKDANIALLEMTSTKKQRNTELQYLPLLFLLQAGSVTAAICEKDASIALLEMTSTRASIRRAYAVYYAQKSAAYAEITHQRRTEDF